MIAPYVNHGRWTGICPTCNAGLMVDPFTERARCESCRVEHWAPMPAGWRKATRILRSRPVVNRNWYPTVESAAFGGGPGAETIDDLIRENEEHGYGLG